MNNAIRNTLVFILSFCNTVFAADLSLSSGAGNPSIDTTRNGIPLVNIAKPNSGGISHNRFSNYNVGRNGLILNNSSKAKETLLGGRVYGNKNVKDGAARLIINEVTSSNRSSLKGYTEVGGQASDVIVANPNGITCDGCGFINVPRGTLTTGRMIVNGSEVNISVDGGDILIDGQGLNATNTDKLSIITRALKLNAKLYANDLEVITGKNDYNYRTGNVTSRGGSGTGLAIDSSALGGMYANKIRLIATDKGVGVNLQGQIAAGVGGFNLTADGKIVVNNVKSKQNISIHSKSSGIQSNVSLRAKDKIVLKSTLGKTILKGKTIARSINIDALELENNGLLVAGVDEAGNMITASTAGDVLDIKGGIITNRSEIYSAGNINLNATTFDNQNATFMASNNSNINVIDLINADGLIYSEKLLALSSSNSINNTQGQIIAGTDNNITTGDLLNDNGTLASNGTLDLTVNNLLNSGGLLSADGFLSVYATDHINNQLGIIQSDADVNLNAQNINNSSGNIYAKNNTNIDTSSLNNSNGEVFAGNNTNIDTSNLKNFNGEVFAGNNTNIDTVNLNNTDGQILAVNKISTKLSGSLTNTNGKLLAGNEVEITSTNELVNDGSIESYGNVKLNTAGLDNYGTINSNNSTILNSTASITNHGVISSQNILDIINSGDLLNVTGAVINASVNAAINSTGNITNDGLIGAGNNLSIEASNVTNNAAISSGQDLTITSTNLTNNKTLYSGRDMNLYTGGLLHNTQGSNIYVNGNLKIAANELNANTTKVLNESATIEAQGDIDVYADELVNTKVEFEKQAGVKTTENTALRSQTVVVAYDYSLEKEALQAEGVPVKQMEAIRGRPLSINEKNIVSITITDRVASYSSPYAKYYEYSTFISDYIVSIKYYSDSQIDAKSAQIADELKYQRMDIDDLASIRQSYIDQGYDKTGEWKQVIDINGMTEYHLDVSFQSDWFDRIKSLMWNGSPSYLKESFYRALSSEISEDVVTKDSPSSYFISGGKMSLNVGTVTNYQSLIAANNNMLITGNTVNNQGEEIAKSIRQQGFDYAYRRTLFISGSDGSEVTESGETLLRGQHGIPTIHTQEVSTAGYSTIQAGGTLQINANELTNEASATKSNYAPVGISATTAEFGNMEAVSDVISGSNIADTDNFDIQLPQDDYGLFISNTSPDHSYLIETNPKFISNSKHLSSTYMIERLLLDPDKIIKRLGDSIYEERLVREQIFKQTGKRFLNGRMSDMEQFKYLMDNALETQKGLRLALGVGLSKSQINRLTQDIVWMEKKIVNGQEVLAPVVYLANLNKDNHKMRGGQIIASIGNINVDNFNNTGSIDTLDGLVINASDSISNIGGNISSRRGIIMAAGNRLDNISGKIKGGDVLLHANKINIETATESETTTNKNGFYQRTYVNDKASVKSDGDLNIISGSGTTITGADINADGDVNIASQGNVEITTAKQTSDYKLDFGRLKTKGNSLTHTTNDISGENVNITSGQGSVLLEGTNVDANNQIDINAKNEVVIASVRNFKYDESKYHKKGTFGDTTVETKKSSTTVLSSTLNAKNINISAETLTMLGSQIEADTVKITADVLKLISDKNSEFFHSYSDKSGALTRTIIDQGYLRETAVPSTISATNLLFNGEGISNPNAIDELISNLSSEYNLSLAQIEQIKATLENKEWYDKTTTLSKLGAIIVQALATYFTAGIGGDLIGTALDGFMKAAVTAAIDSVANQFVSQLLTAAITGESPEFDLEAMAKGAILAGISSGISFKADALIQNANLGNIGGKLADTVSDAAIKTAVYGGSFEDNILDVAIDNIGADVAGFIGDKTDASSLQNIISHAVLGCALGEAKAGDCASGAAGATLSAALAPQIAKSVDDGDGVLSADEKAQVKMLAQIATALIVAGAGEDVDTANYTALNEVTNNYLNHSQMSLMAGELKDCKTQQCREDVVKKFNKISDNNLGKLVTTCAGSGSKSSECLELTKEQNESILNYQNGKYDFDLGQGGDYMYDAMFEMHKTNLEEQFVSAELAMLDLGKMVGKALGIPPAQALAIGTALATGAYKGGKLAIKGIRKIKEMPAKNKNMVAGCVLALGGSCPDSNLHSNVQVNPIKHKHPGPGLEVKTDKSKMERMRRKIDVDNFLKSRETKLNE